MVNCLTASGPGESRQIPSGKLGHFVNMLQRWIMERVDQWFWGCILGQDAANYSANSTKLSTLPDVELVTKSVPCPKMQFSKLAWSLSLRPLSLGRRKHPRGVYLMLIIIQYRRGGACFDPNNHTSHTNVGM